MTELGKCYTASPFWTDYEKLVKKFMIKQVQTSGYLICDPEDCGDLSSEKERDKFEFAVKIFDKNIQDIKNSEILVFPKYTTDLGTLFEVGYAFGLKKPIFRYDFLADKCEELNLDVFKHSEYLSLWENIDNVWINIEEQADAVLFGYLASVLPEAEHRLSYTLKGCQDNLMLSARYAYKTDEGLIRPYDRNWEEMR